MDSSSFNDALWREQKDKLMIVGNRIRRLPSSTDEILILLELEYDFVFRLFFEEAESILVGVWQGIPRSKVGPLQPIMTALITDELFRHADLNIQVAVASCFNELTRITAPQFPYPDDLMKEIFQLFMVALKQLSTESGSNFVRAHQILRALATEKSCLIMLDIEIDAVIVEMFQLFFDTIRSNLASDFFNYMETIMTLIIEESDEVSLELLRPLLDSVRKNNKEISPMSWELGITVFEKCGTKLKHCLREAVKQLNLKVDDYAEIVASICKVTSNGQNMVSESDEIYKADEEDCTPQLEDGNNPTENSAEDLQPRIISASSDTETSQSEKGVGAHRAKRFRKPNSLLRLEEGYAHIWTIGRQGSSSEQHDWNNKAKKQESRKKIRRGLISQKDKSRDVADENVESPMAPEKEEMCNRSNFEHGEEIVNARIMVWWPLDKTFYTGTVESFDPLAKKHKIKYDDDEEEVLNLREEKWELFNERPQQIQSSKK